MTNKDILKESKKIANTFSGKLAEIIADFKYDMEQLLYDNKVIEDYDQLDYIELNKDLAQVEELVDNLNSIENGMDEMDLTIQEINKTLEDK